MRISLVTGAGSGIGAATARLLHERGDAVVCADLDGPRVADVARDLDRATAVECDVTDQDAVDRMIDTALTEYGDLDAVVACAGIEVPADTLDLDIELFRHIVDVNLTGSFLTAQRAARAMRDRGHGGAVVLIGSLNSQAALPRAAPYCASKGGVLMLGRALALDLAAYGIRVNVIGPGVTDTPMSAESLADEVASAALLDRIPLRRPARPGEIASAAAFLTSEDASYITGAFVPVDGGWLAN